MEYLLSVHLIEGEPELTDEEKQRSDVLVGQVIEELREAGVWVFAGGLTDPASATVVRAHTGTVTVTDGPFVETKEQLAGFWVIRCADLDEALRWAEKCSVACLGPIEVRPFDGLLV